MNYRERQFAFGRLLSSIYEGDEASKKSKEEIRRIIDVWNKTAEFMDYGILEAPNISVIPIYANAKLNGKTKSKTNEELFTPLKNYNYSDDKVKLEFAKNKIEWMPNVNYNQAKELEEKLFEKAKYQKIEVDHSLNELQINKVVIKYSRSLYYNDLHAEGQNELEAICNSCIYFMENQKKLKREFSGVFVDNTTGHF